MSVPPGLTVERGLLDTSVVIALEQLAPASWPQGSAIAAIAWPN